VQHFLGICIILMVFSKYTVPVEHLEWDKQCHGWFQMIIVTDSPFIKEAELLPLETRKYEEDHGFQQSRSRCSIVHSIK
jgi:hypothetical protein